MSSTLRVFTLIALGASRSLADASLDPPVAKIDQAAKTALQANWPQMSNHKLLMRDIKIEMSIRETNTTCVVEVTYEFLESAHTTVGVDAAVTNHYRGVTLLMNREGKCDPRSIIFFSGNEVVSPSGSISKYENLEPLLPRTIGTPPKKAAASGTRRSDGAP